MIAEDYLMLMMEGNAGSLERVNSNLPRLRVRDSDLALFQALRQLQIHLHFHPTLISSPVPFSFSFGNEVRHYFVLFRSLRRNFAGSQATGEENEQAFAVEEIRVYKHIILLQSSCLCLVPQCFTR